MFINNKIKKNNITEEENLHDIWKISIPDKGKRTRWKHSFLGLRKRLQCD